MMVVMVSKCEAVSVIAVYINTAVIFVHDGGTGTVGGQCKWYN